MQHPDEIPTQHLPVVPEETPTHLLPTAPRTPSSAPNASRRRFLQGAAIATATAAAVSAAGVMAASASHQDIKNAIQTFGPQQGTLSGCVTAASMCIEAGNGCATPLHAYKPISTFKVISGHNNSFSTLPSEFFLWFTATNLPAGTYAISLNIAPGFTMIRDKEEPAGIEVDLFVEKPCTAIACPTSERLGKEHHYANLAALSSVVLSSVSDVQVKVYLKYTGTKPTNGQSFSFTGSLTGGAININSGIAITAVV